MRQTRRMADNRRPIWQPGTPVALLLAGLFLATLATAWVQIVVAEHSWSYGGWRITYAAGFLRRGLSGSLIDALPISPSIAVFLVVAVATALLYQATWCLTRGATPALLLCLASPAALLFPIGDPEGAFRGELLFLALFAQMLRLQQSGQTSLIPSLSLLLPVLVLIHEITLFLLPALLPILAANWQSRRLRIAVAGTAVAAGALLISPATPEQMATLCAAPHPACAPDGPAHRLAETLPEARAALTPLLQSYGAELPWILAFSLAPLALAARAANLAPVSKAGLALTALALTGLGAIASDWGRFLAAFTLIATLQMAASTAPASRLPPWALPAALALALSWRLGHYHHLLRPGFAAEALSRLTGG